MRSITVHLFTVIIRKGCSNVVGSRLSLLCYILIVGRSKPDESEAALQLVSIIYTLSLIKAPHFILNCLISLGISVFLPALIHSMHLLSALLAYLIMVIMVLFFLVYSERVRILIWCGCSQNCSAKPFPSHWWIRQLRICKEVISNIRKWYESCRILMVLINV